MEFEKKSTISFKQIILEHLKKILEISREEFTGGYWNKKQIGNFKEETYIPNTRKKYIQSIDSFSDVLTPFFDKTMNDEYKEIQKKLKTQKDKIIKQKILKSKGDEEFTEIKLEIMRELFRKLNLLLFRVDYLKGEVYDEDEDQ